MSLREHYLAYLTALNERRFADLPAFIAPRLTYNGDPTTLAGYQRARAAEAATIPDLRYEVGLLVVEGPHVAARLLFDCSPVGDFLGFAAAGRRISFTEHVFYRFDDDRRVVEVTSLLDVPAIARQLEASPGHDRGATSPGR